MLFASKEQSAVGCTSLEHLVKSENIHDHDLNVVFVHISNMFGIELIKCTTLNDLNYLVMINFISQNIIKMR